MLILMVALAAAATIVAPDGRKVIAGERCYALELNGAEVGSTRQTIRADRIGRRRVWDVIIHQRVPARKFDMRDHFVLDARNLRPIAFDNARGGEEHVRLAYADDRITGRKLDKAVATPVAASTPGPVWEGNLYGVHIGALPLKQGATFELPFYQYDKGFGRFIFVVTGSERVATSTGAADAWVVTVDNGGVTRATYLIDKRDGAELATRAGPFVTRSVACGSIPQP